MAEKEKKTLTAFEIMRKPFEPHHISKLCKPTKRDNQPGRCKDCGGWHKLPSVQLSYVGHAALTDRLLDADPKWTWEPLALAPNGTPLLDSDGGMWIKLTVAGVTRLGYGDAQGKTGGDATKERIGDALRNAAMRFGAALELWHKGDLHLAEGEATQEAETMEKIQEAETRADVREADAQAYLAERIAPFQVSELEKRWKANAWTPKQVTAFLTELGNYVQLEEISKAHFNDAMKAFSKPPQVPADLERALQASLPMAKAKPAPVPKKGPNRFAKMFAMAKSKNIPDDDVRKMAQESYGKSHLSDLDADELAGIEGWLDGLPAS